MRNSFRIALAGNPNCGKTSIFNVLTGTRQHVGNYPGVTVESKKGSFTLNGMKIELIDLPGVYSLSSASPEEEVVFQELTKKGIDLVINVIDSTNPNRNLYLTTQLAELHIPMLLAFNMSDDARKKGLKFDIPKLEKYFGSPIVQTVGSKADGITPLLNALEKALSNLEDHGVPMLTYGKDIDDAIEIVAAEIDKLAIERFSHIPARFFAIKLLEHDTAVMSIEDFKPVFKIVEGEILHLRKKHAIDADTFMADRRYAMLSGACRNTISMTGERRREISDKIDMVMTNKFLGLPIFFLIIYATFCFTFICAEPFMGYIEDLFSFLSTTLKDIWPETSCPYVRTLVTDGILGGVGGVIVFLPNILFLFFAIAILEDSGYMSRAAFVMDGLMRQFGLQGRSFVPLILGFGCTVPAIMATRTIESQKDRTVTIMVLPLMSCSARLPIYALIIPALFAQKYQAFVMWLIYLIGVLMALTAALIMKKTLFKGDGEVYLMELPPYRMPSVKSLLLHMWDRSGMYLRKAGTIILATSVLLYICNTYPVKKEFSRNYDLLISEIQKENSLTDAQLTLLEKAKLFKNTDWKHIREKRSIPANLLEKVNTTELSPEIKTLLLKEEKANAAIAKLKNEKLAEMLQYTISGRLGCFLEPVFRPLGFDWKISTAAIGALAAKEVFVSQLGILHAEGEVDENSESLREQLVKTYTPLQGFCIMLFCLLSIPCIATLAIIRRELNSWKMAGVEALGLFLLAYTVTFIVYQLGNLLQIGNKLIC